jgi:precorrin-6Y C5,15-methyltransferase (decarboxylating)
MIRKADILVAGRRHLAAFSNHPGIQKEIGRNIPELMGFIGQHYPTHQVVVLASGDPLLHGIGARIIEHLGSDQVEVFPNISSVAAAFARIGEPWQDARIVSLHGKAAETSLLQTVSTTRLVAVLTDPVRNPAWIGSLLRRHSLLDVRLCVMEQLGTPAEKLSWHNPDDIVDQTFSEPNIVILKRDTAPDALSALHLGMPDDAYEHENGLITKAEIRAVSLAKLRLLPHHVLWDLGAGSGSIGIEASVLVPRGRIVAIEKHPDRIRNIEENRLRHGVVNMEIRQATLPDGLDGLPAPDRVFIGGGGRHLETIIRTAAGYLPSDGVMVLNTVLFDNLSTSLTVLKELGFLTETVQIQINRSREMPWSERFEALSPVWIITGT